MGAMMADLEALPMVFFFFFFCRRRHPAEVATLANRAMSTQIISDPQIRISITDHFILAYSHQ